VKVYSRVTGESFESDPETQFKQRMARMRNRVWWGCANVSRETNAIGGSMIMVTLTYRRVDQWAPTQISEWCKYWRDETGRAYVWVAELQRRGAMHYHFLSSIDDGYKWNKEKYDFAWYHGFTWVTPDVERPFYIGKYLQKEYQKNGKQFPRGARIVGYSRPSRVISDRANNERLVSRYPNWVSGELDKEGIREIGGNISRARGGFRVGSGMAISPYSRYELADAVRVGELMALAHKGDIVYTDGHWELPKTTHLPEGVG